MNTKSSRPSPSVGDFSGDSAAQVEPALRSLPRTVHGSCVELCGRGALMIGKSGSGKSSLALQLISLGACLVGDDQVVLSEADGAILAQALPRNPGLRLGAIEARWIGILDAPVCERVALSVVIDLDQPEPSRLPEAREIRFASVTVPLLHGQGVSGLGPAIALILRSGRRPDAFA